MSSEGKSADVRIHCRCAGGDHAQVTRLVDEPTTYRCTLCGLRGFGPRYACSGCGVICHQFCGIGLPSDPPCFLHPGEHCMALGSSEGSPSEPKCFLCEKDIAAGASFYECDQQSKTRVHLFCYQFRQKMAPAGFTPGRTIKHWSHPYPFEEIYKADIYHCHGCGDKGYGLRFRCKSCTLTLHHCCAECPEKLPYYVYAEKSEAGNGILECHLCGDQIHRSKMSNGATAVGLHYACKPVYLHPLCVQLQQYQPAPGDDPSSTGKTSKSDSSTSSTGKTSKSDSTTSSDIDKATDKASGTKTDTATSESMVTTAHDVIKRVITNNAIISTVTTIKRVVLAAFWMVITNISSVFKQTHTRTAANNTIATVTKGAASAATTIKETITSTSIRGTATTIKSSIACTTTDKRAITDTATTIKRTIVTTATTIKNTIAASFRIMTNSPIVGVITKSNAISVNSTNGTSNSNIQKRIIRTAIAIAFLAFIIFVISGPPSTNITTDTTSSTTVGVTTATTCSCEQGAGQATAKNELIALYFNLGKAIAKYTGDPKVGSAIRMAESALLEYSRKE